MFNKQSSLKFKFVLVFLLVGLIPVLTVTVLSYFNAKSNIEEEVFKALEMYSSITDAQVSSYLLEREGNARVFVSSNNVIEAMAALQAAGRNQSDPMWLELKRDLDRYAQIFVEDQGYSYVFLTDVYGRAVYSSQPGVEGADLSVREYVRQAMQGTINWSDLYLSNVVNENTLVYSIPVRAEGVRGSIIGTANFAITEEALTDFVHSGIEELGAMGDAYLVNADGLLLTSTILGELAENASLNESIETTIVRELAAPVQQGETDFSWQGIYTGHLGNRVLGAAEVLPFGRSFAGLVVEIDEAEAFAGVYAMRNYMLVVLLVTILLVVGIGYYTAVNTARPIVAVAAVAQQVADGDFTVTTEINRSDEIGILAEAFNTMSNNLRQLFHQAVQTAQGVNQGSEALSQAVESVSASLEEVAASTSEFAANAQEMSATSQEMAELSGQVAANAAEGNTAVESAVRQMQEINDMVADLQNVIRALDDRSRDIGNIIELISEVAEQTNLLALNAAIEAARAGEQGRGFAVVAEEVRKLAEQSHSSAEQIAKLVKVTQEESSNAVLSMQKGVETVRSGSEVVLASGEIFKKILDSVNSIVNNVEAVSASAEEISAGSEEIAASTEEQSSVMEEINASAEELRENAEALIQELNRFKV